MNYTILNYTESCLRSEKALTCSYCCTLGARDLFRALIFLAKACRERTSGNLWNLWYPTVPYQIFVKILHFLLTAECDINAVFTSKQYLPMRQSILQNTHSRSTHNETQRHDRRYRSR